MFSILKPTYTLKIKIQDEFKTFVLAPGFQAGPQGAYQYYKGHEGDIGANTVLADIKKALEVAGIKAEVTLEKFEHTA